MTEHGMHTYRSGSAAEPELRVEIHDRTAVLTLNRPRRRNALTSALLEELRAALVRLDRDDGVAVVVLTGADPAFCAGLDLDELSSAEGGLTSGGVSSSFQGPLPPIRKPLLGAVNGDAVTGGLELALACDVLIGSTRARFADTHVRFGMVPAWGMIARLPERIGAARAIEMSVSASFVSADAAHRWGLLNHVVPHDELMPQTLALASDIAANDTGAVQAVLAAYASVARTTEEHGWIVESELANDWQGDGIDPSSVAKRRTAAVTRSPDRAQR